MNEPCPFCGEATIFDGRRWDPPGFPYPHGCQVGVKVPNEGDFCPSCSTLTWGEACSECKPVPMQKQRDTPRIRPVQEDLPL